MTSTTKIWGTYEQFRDKCMRPDAAALLTLAVIVADFREDLMTNFIRDQSCRAGRHDGQRDFAREKET
ncbi:MAG: hypothetical protein ACE15C_14835 [Phycisphaerae bacterium]